MLFRWNFHTKAARFQGSQCFISSYHAIPETEASAAFVLSRLKRCANRDPKPATCYPSVISESCLPAGNDLLGKLLRGKASTHASRPEETEHRAVVPMMLIPQEQVQAYTIFFDGRKAGSISLAVLAADPFGIL